MKQIIGILLIVFCYVFFLNSCQKSTGDGGGSTVPIAPVDSLYNPVDPVIAGSQGFFLDDWVAKAFTLPSYTLTSATTSTPTDTINLDANAVVTKVSKYLFGNNVNLWMGQVVTQPVLMSYLTDLSPNIIRGPGGSISDVYFWNSSTKPADVPDSLYDTNGSKVATSYWYGQNTANWTMSIDNYYTLLSQTGSTGILTVNYAYARYGLSANPVATAAHLAADWVRYDKGRTKYWEIGNEDNGTWETSYKIDITKNKDGQAQIISGSLYGQHFKVFADSMRAAANQIGVSIKIGAQVIGVDPSSSGNTVDKTWNAGMFAMIGNAADFFIVHDYFTPFHANSLASDILTTAVSEPLAIKSYVTSSTAANMVSMKPIALTEWNIEAEGSKQKVSHINGMHAVITMGELLKDQFGQASRWDLANGYAGGNDHGLFNIGDEPGAPLWNPRPAFYHMYYLQKFLGDRVITTTTKSTGIIAYSSTFTSGQVTSVIVNKTTLNRTVAINISHRTLGAKYYWYTLSGGTDNGEFSGQVFVNGTGPSTATGGPLAYATIKANAASIAGTIKVDVPARSVVFLATDKK